MSRFVSCVLLWCETGSVELRDHVTMRRRHELFSVLSLSLAHSLWKMYSLIFFFVSDVFLSPRLPSWMLSIFDHVLMSLAEQCLLSRKKKYSLCPHSNCSWHLYNLYIIKWFIFNVHMCPCLFWVRGSKASVFWCSKAVPGFVVVDAFRFGEDRCTSLKSPGASPPWQTLKGRVHRCQACPNPQFTRSYKELSDGPSAGLQRSCLGWRLVEVRLLKFSN